jgi:hypothetical protein
MATEPLLCSAHRLWVYRRSQVVRKAALTTQRFSAGEEPRLKFALRQHDRHGHVVSRVLRSLEELGAKGCRAVIIAVEYNERRTATNNLSAGKIHSPLKLTRLQEFAPWNTNGREHPPQRWWVEAFSDTSNEDGYSFSITVSFNNARELHLHQASRPLGSGNSMFDGSSVGWGSGRN